MRPAAAAVVVAAAIAFAMAAAVARRGRGDGARCGKGFVPRGARCLGPPSCAPPLERTSRGCDAPDVRILVPETTLVLGAADWEAEGRVASRTVRVPAFRIAAFETTRGAWSARPAAGEDAGPVGIDDAARAMTGISRDEAAAFCAARGGRLPSESEWIAAAGSGMNPPRRYPWGDTGAVCRRAAWGLLAGPCAAGADGPDTVGAHPDGDSAVGLHDLSGNAAEWVAPDPGRPGDRDLPVGVAKGGSWQSTLASELRIWARIELDPASHDPRVGVRCAYPP